MTGRRAARHAGGKPPKSPMSTAATTPAAKLGSVKRNENTTSPTLRSLSSRPAADARAHARHSPMSPPAAPIITLSARKLAKIVALPKP